MTSEANYTEVAARNSSHHCDTRRSNVTPTCGMPHPCHVRQYPVKWPVSVGTGNRHSSRFVHYSNSLPTLGFALPGTSEIFTATSKHSQPFCYQYQLFQKAACLIDPSVSLKSSPGVDKINCNIQIKRISLTETWFFVLVRQHK